MKRFEWLDFVISTLFQLASSTRLPDIEWGEDWRMALKQILNGVGMFASSASFRRSFLLMCFGTVVVAQVPYAAAADPVDLNVEFTKGDQHRIAMKLEHHGKVIIDGAGQEKVQTLPMDTVARLGYYQRYTGNSTDHQAIRFYDKSKGIYKISKGDTSATLADNNRLIVARVKSQPGKRIQLASVESTLKQAEFELLRNPVDPLSLPSLLNRKDVKVGQTWKPDNDGLANFLAVDRIVRNDIQLKLKEIKEGIARIYITGKLRASVDDVTTDMDVVSLALVDMKRQQVTTVRLKVREIRQPGQVAPGFDGETNIDMKVESNNNCPQLTNAALAEATKSKVIEQRFRWESPEGQFLLTYDPRWRVIAAEDEAAVFRYLNNGMLLAQCNVVQLPSRPADNPLTLSDYKREVFKIIEADPKAKIVDATEFKTDENAYALRVHVSGEEDGVDVSWVYYHVSSIDGRRLTFVFTLEDDVRKLFRPADEMMVNSVKFFPVAGRKASAKTAAEKTSTRR